MADSKPAPEIATHRDKPKKRRGPGLNIFLFLATLATTWSAGFTGRTLEEAVNNGLIYMASVMGIILSHEMGHYILARRNRIDASLPYCIPMPLPPIGTFGAVIVMRGRIRSRNALMEVGAAGPLAGMVTAVPILLVGLSLSSVVPLGQEGIVLGESLLYMQLVQIAIGDIPEGYDVMIHPMAWAGWIGLLLTMLNLLPIGQLDGGHIFYALWGKLHARISRIFFIGLFFLGFGVMGHEALAAWRDGLEGDAFWIRVITGTNWLFLGSLLFLFFGRKKGRGFRHPPTDDGDLSPGHRIVGFVCIILFIITFMPVPFRILF
ncbi:MAG: site-2 protease family protein [Proteobacteria bacterium]|nr:site-2 protease family protein [Pseudomonadota bacterium]